MRRVRVASYARWLPVLSCSRWKEEGFGVEFRAPALSLEMVVIPTGRVKEMCVEQKKKVRERVETFMVPFRVDLT